MRTVEKVIVQASEFDGAADKRSLCVRNMLLLARLRVEPSVWSREPKVSEVDRPPRVVTMGKHDSLSSNVTMDNVMRMDKLDRVQLQEDFSASVTSSAPR